jgi:hypothetical protein
MDALWSSRRRVDDLQHGARDLTPDFDVCPAVALLLHLDKPPLNVHQGVGAVLVHHESREKPYSAFHAVSVGNQG